MKQVSLGNSKTAPDVTHVNSDHLFRDGHR
jgi:hypothetical protein